MKLSSWLSPSATDRPPLFRLAFLLTSLSTASQAVTFNPVPSANLDLSQLGRVGLAGDFSGISLYQFKGQNQNGFSTNGSQSILSRFPNGGFATLASADAGIQAMCTFIMKDGTMAGVVVGGNFTSLGGMESQGAALFNPNTSAITPLTGLSGQVSALFCDQESNTVYVGGSFKGANSTNAIAWVGTAGWTNLPFAGFNGPVTSISKASNGNIIFGGSFTGLGNATGPSQPDQQLVNIGGGTITSGSSSSTAGFSDPRNIICKTSGTDGAGNTWLLADSTPGFWNARFGFGFQPTKLRLYNTNQDGRGTKTWRYTAFPINGIMNFTYIDPATGQNSSCTSECPLSNDPKVQFQEFHFVNQVGMNSFQIDISDWYGRGGGLNGIELFQDDIFAYSINTFNEPTCAGVKITSNATTTGPWTVTPSRQSVSDYLSVTITGQETPNVVFSPDIRQSGNYSVNIYTPGCIQDNTCATRGRVNVTGIMASGSSSAGFHTEIFQTNNFDKYDQIYFGFIEAGTSSFRPTITLSPSAGQGIPNLSIVAQRVGFTLISSTGGLNSLFEYNPTQLVVTTADFTNSTFTKAGMDLPTGAGVSTLQASGQTTFVGGNFSTKTHNNIFSITGSDVTALSGNGLNGEVLSMFLDGTTLYVGGSFTDTKQGGATGLSRIAAYDTSARSWIALGAGVNGMVTNIVPLKMNITANKPETVVTLTGVFDQILAFGGNSSSRVTGFAVWVPSRGNWLQNLNIATIAIDGALSTSVEMADGEVLFAGTVSTSQLSANGIVALSDSLNPFPVKIRRPETQAVNSLTKRATSNQNVTGVVTGLFYEQGGLNVTILGGHFSATGSNGSNVNNLLFLNGSNSNIVTGVSSAISNDSTILALAIQRDNLWAGGALTGSVNNANVNALVTFNLTSSTFNTQPPTLGGGDVFTITTRPNSEDVYVGGSFSSAGSLECPAVCIFTTVVAQWDRPGSNLAGTANTMMWTSSNSLLVGGDLTLNGASVALATYDARAQNWTTTPGAEAIPGPVSTISAANNDNSEFWVAGKSTNGSAFLMKYDGSKWKSVGDTLGSGTNIRGLKVLSLTDNHDSSDLVSASQTLMITGSLNLPGFGNASAVLFNGTTFQPFALTTTASNTGGSLSQIFSQKENFFRSPGGRLKVSYVVAISLAIALGLIFLLVVAGLLADRLRKKREGYMPAPTSTYDRSHATTRIPPSQLFSSLGQNRSGVEKQGRMI